MKKSIIFEGPDCLGKSTLIRQIIDKYGFCNVIHNSIPKVLSCYKNEPNPKFKYNYELYLQGFKLLQNNVPIIFDRFHLSETVYAPRYRGYSGDYVYELESLINTDNVKLVLLTTSDWSFIEDDGRSLDFSKREDEQEDFIKAFHKSRIKDKVIINIVDATGNRKSSCDLIKEIYG